MAQSKEGYFLNRDTTESQRLNVQHEIYTTNVGFLIHPDIPTSSPTLKIADIGTGTGIWLYEVSKTLPSTCALFGYDISAAQFPASSTWPHNLSLHAHSALDPFPEDEQGTYDIVAVRLLVLGLARGQWDIAVRNLFTLLKPGGYLQWIDVDVSSTVTRVPQNVPGASKAALLEVNEAFTSLCAATNREVSECWKLKGLFQENGLVDVQEDIFKSDRLPELRDRFTSCSVNGLKAVLFRAAEMCLEGWTKERAERVAKEVDGEISSGKVYTSTFIVCVTGKKRSYI